MPDVSGKYGPRPGHIPGVPINLGGHEFVLAPLTLAMAREIETRGEALRANTEATQDDHIAFGQWIVLQSLQRNYPDITAEELAPLLDSANIEEAQAAIAGTSGLRRVKPGELTPGG